MPPSFPVEAITRRADVASALTTARALLFPTTNATAIARHESFVPVLNPLTAQIVYHKSFLFAELPSYGSMRQTPFFSEAHRCDLKVLDSVLVGGDRTPSFLAVKEATGIPVLILILALGNELLFTQFYTVGEITKAMSKMLGSVVCKSMSVLSMTLHANLREVRDAFQAELRAQKAALGQTGCS
eukprot:CAMPEP_0185854266 /NCGR_PEP_ID=MMETSP1354-20130828/21847_1 /TAXON_ID=708628 /ORGANISM="Erythrolobus madagascarensis, Strain CCMP3276" /LENGTH=184 /DNA_ID=CAMNT_0028555987 /DNA_START=660 /DNA_END=1214 /DNA_ORIENTATION=-